MKIIFIRHAEKEKEGKNPPLTKKGIKQAKLLSKVLKKKNFEEIYCSNMNRAKQTAEIVSKKIKIQPKIKPFLNEFKTSFLKNHKNKWSSQEKKQFRDLIDFLKKITKKSNKKKSILIISHGITNRIIVSYFLKLSLKQVIPFMQKETCINTIYWFKKYKNWRLKEWNNFNHLSKKLR